MLAKSAVIKQPVERRGAMKSVEPMPATDEALLQAGANADAEAYRQLVERHLPFVRAVATRMLQDAAEADDIAQEVFLRLWRNLPTLAADGRGAKAWLRRVTANLCIDRIRANAKTTVTDRPPDQEVEASQMDGMSEKALAARVAAALQQLPKRQRLALVLFHFEGLSQQEVSEAMSVSQEAVESLLGRARRKLKSTLRDDWQEMLAEVTD